MSLCSATFYTPTSNDCRGSEIVSTRFDDNTALLTYRAEQNTKCGKITVPSPTWVSSLFARRNRKWVNALYQHTREE